MRCAPCEVRARESWAGEAQTTAPTHGSYAVHTPFGASADRKNGSLSTWLLGAAPGWRGVVFAPEMRDARPTLQRRPRHQQWILRRDYHDLSSSYGMQIYPGRLRKPNILHPTNTSPETNTTHRSTQC